VADVPDGRRRPDARPAHHFRIYAPDKIPYAIDRYSNEAKRLYGVMDKRLANSRYIAGPAYSIADIAIFPWLRSWKNQGIQWSDYPHLKGWFDEIAARPAVQRGVEVLASQRKPLVSDAAREAPVRRDPIPAPLTAAAAARRLLPGMRGPRRERGRQEWRACRLRHLVGRCRGSVGKAGRRQRVASDGRGLSGPG
jgi:hypothetical protein